MHAATWANVGRPLTSDYWQPLATGGLYRPLTTLCYVATYAVFGAAPFAYHATNLVLHVTWSPPPSPAIGSRS